MRESARKRSLEAAKTMCACFPNDWHSYLKGDICDPGSECHCPECLFASGTLCLAARPYFWQGNLNIEFDCSVIASIPLVEIVTVKASKNLKVQQLSTTGMQQVPSQSVTNLNFQQISITYGIWF